MVKYWTGKIMANQIFGGDWQSPLFYIQDISKANIGLVKDYFGKLTTTCQYFATYGMHQLSFSIYQVFTHNTCIISSNCNVIVGNNCKGLFQYCPTLEVTHCFQKVTLSSRAYRSLVYIKHKLITSMYCAWSTINHTSDYIGVEISFS